MTVYVIDAHTAIELARRGYEREPERNLFAPTLLRSQVLAILHTELHTDGGDPRQLLDLAQRACGLPHRLLGDAVLRRAAWEIATQQGWPETYDAEYIALTRLHGEALVAGSDTLRAKAAILVPTKTVNHLIGGT